VNTEPNLTLANMPENTQGQVISASEDNTEIQSRLYALGIYPGVVIDVLRFAPTGDPIQVRIGRTLLSVRKSEAQLIQVNKTSPSIELEPR